MHLLHSLLKQFQAQRRAADAVGFGQTPDSTHHQRITALARAQAFDEAAQAVADAIESAPAECLELLDRIELLRKCNLAASERHPDRIQRERAAGAADCCARLLSSFASVEETEECSAV